MGDYLDYVMIPAGMIADRVEKMAEVIYNRYKGETVHLLCVLKGANAFFNILAEKLTERHKYSGSNNIPFILDFVHVSSYSGTSSTGKVTIKGVDLDSLKGKHVLLVEDIIDTGNTMKKLIPTLRNDVEPKSIGIATLLEKRREGKPIAYEAEFSGFSIPDEFIVGCGLDYNQVFRDLVHICVINDAGKQKWA